MTCLLVLNCSCRCNCSGTVTSELTQFWIGTELSLFCTQSQSQSYVTTDNQSASLSWYKAPMWGLKPDLYFCQTVAGLWIWGALSDERTGLSFARVTVISS
jgi:hypothetical protein